MQFLKSAIPDFLLTLVASTALVFTVSYGFESAPDMRANVWVCMGLVAPMLVVLFAGAWSKRALAPSAVAAMVYAVAVFAALGAQVPVDVPLVVDGQVNDVAENPLLFGIVSMVVPVAVYLLSRRRIGTVVLFAAAVLACAIVQFLYRDWSTAQPGTLAAFVAILSCGGLFVFQSYRQAVYRARRLSKTAFGAAAAFSLLIVALCVGASSALYYTVIDPLQLQTPEIKPFEDYYQKPVIEYRSLYEEQEIENPDVLTNMTNDQNDQTNQDAEGGAEGQTSEEQQDWTGSPLSALIRNTLSFSADSWNEAFQAVSYQTLAIGTVVALLLIALVVGLAVFLQRRRRVKRLESVQDKPQAYRVWFLYTFLTGRLERLGFTKPDTFTPLEFAMASRNAMAQFAQGTGGVDYLELTLIYQRACYAPETLVDSDEAEIVRYYEHFFANARSFVGKRRWLWMFWRI